MSTLRKRPYTSSVFEKLFNQYLFDVYVDDHVFLAMSGVSSFRDIRISSYKGFWMPRSLHMGISGIRRKEYEANYRLCKKMEDVAAVESMRFRKCIKESE